MIRPIRDTDRTAIAQLSEASGLFSDEELVEVASMVDAFLGGDLDEDHRWVTYEATRLEGVAYFAPEGFSDGVWNLYMLAVSQEAQGQGVGAALVDHTVETARERGGRILLVETSGVEGFARTREFYERCGFVREATIRDYYGRGDDKVVFWKSIAG